MGAFDTRFDPPDRPLGPFESLAYPPRFGWPSSDGTAQQLAAEPRPGEDDSGGRSAVYKELRGVGPTFLDSEFSSMLDQFDQYAREHGVTPLYTSAYRSPATQAELRTSGRETTPALHSLHSVGLAVDVNYTPLHADEQRVLREAAANAGLSWGGTFPDPDRVHFYHDPGGDRAALIDNFSRQIPPP